MKTKTDLSKYEKMYDSFDKGHDRKHLEEVRDFALVLGQKYAPDKLELIYVSATLHDIGLSVERDTHELHGYELVQNNEELKKVYSVQEVAEILEAVKEHRASNGRPNGVIAKIVSDADKVAAGTNRVFRRAYEWGSRHFPQVNHHGQLLRAAQHLYIKFGPNGTGTRLYFEESKKRLDDTFKPIFDAVEKNDLKSMESFLE